MARVERAKRKKSLSAAPRQRHRTLDRHERDVGAERSGELDQSRAQRIRRQRVQAPEDSTGVRAAPTESSTDRNSLVDLDRESGGPTRCLAVSDRSAIREIALCGPES